MTTSFFAGYSLNENQTEVVENLLSEIRNNDFKQSCRAASTGNVTVSSAPSTMDGVSLNANDRVLLWQQTDATENGIYVFSAASSVLTRSEDADTSEEVSSGLLTMVTEGDTHVQKIFTLTNSDPVTLGTTELVFQHYTGAKGTAVQIAGFLEGPTAKDYTLLSRNSAEFIGTSLYLKTSAGTCLATISVNGSPISGLTDIAVNSSGVTATPSGTMTVAVDDRIVLTLSSISSAANLEFDLKGTRT